MYSWRAKPGCEREFADWAADITAAAARFPGSLAACVLPEEGTRELLTLMTYVQMPVVTRLLRRWL